MHVKGGSPEATYDAVESNPLENSPKTEIINEK